MADAHPSTEGRGSTPDRSKLSGEVTRILTDMAHGRLGAAEPSGSATDALFPVVYDELKRIAAGMMVRENSGHTLQPTALVHEAYLRLMSGSGVDSSWQNRAHFFGAAALAMRRILIDRARHVKSTRLEGRAGSGPSADQQAIVDPGSFAGVSDADELLHLDAALDELKQRDERQYDVVMLRYFAGLTIDQTAQAIGLSAATVKNEWAYARAWLLRQIKQRLGVQGA